MTDPQVHEDIALLSTGYTKAVLAIVELNGQIEELKGRMEALESRFGGHNPSGVTGEQPGATATAVVATCRTCRLWQEEDQISHEHEEQA